VRVAPDSSPLGLRRLVYELRRRGLDLLPSRSTVKPKRHPSSGTRHTNQYGMQDRNPRHTKPAGIRQWEPHTECRDRNVGTRHHVRGAYGRTEHADLHSESGRRPLPALASPTINQMKLSKRPPLGFSMKLAHLS
jgi:hypothetical protein